MGPLVIHKDPETAIRAILVRLHPDMATETEALLKQLWLEVAPDVTPQFGLLQDDLVNSIRDPRKMYQSIGYTASLMAIIVACVGLIGLAMHMLSRRTKEVGVRKVLGASAHALFVLLSLPIVRLAVIGCVIGSTLCPFLRCARTCNASLFKYHWNQCSLQDRRLAVSPWHLWQFHITPHALCKQTL